MLLALLAQAATEAPPPDFVELGTSAIVALTPVLTVLVLWGFKVLYSKLPASAILLAAPVLGMGIDWLLSYLSGHPSSDPLISALLGAVAVWLREIGSTLRSKGFSGPFSPTKGSF